MADCNYCKHCGKETHNAKFCSLSCSGKNCKLEKTGWFGLTKEEYYASRRKILDENGYQNKELVVIT